MDWMIDERIVEIGERIRASRESRVELATASERMVGKSHRMGKMVDALQEMLSELRDTELEDMEFLEALMSATGLDTQLTIEEVISGD